MSSEDVAAAIIFSVASFFGTFVMVVAGVGNAIVFLAVYTIAVSIRPLSCDYCEMKAAIFLQALSLSAILPFLLWGCRDVLQKKTNKGLLLTFIPGTIAGTPVGSVVQSHVNVAVLILIVGAILTLFSIFQVLRFRKQYIAERGKPEAIPRQSYLSTRQMPRLGREANDEGVEGENNIQGNSAAGRTSVVLATPTTDDNDNEDGSDETSARDSSAPRPPTGVKFLVFGLVIGFITGFIGALVGVRAGPILIFFSYYQYPKDEVRANMMLVTVAITFMRLIFYVVDSSRRGDDGDGTASSKWFQPHIWYLYVAVCLAGVFAIPMGLMVNKRVNQRGFDVILILGLTFSGIMCIWKGVQLILAD